MVSTAFLSMAPLGLGVALDSLARPGVRTLQRWYRRWSGAILGAGGIRVHAILRDDRFLEDPVVLVANHQVAIDIPVAMQAVSLPFGFVAKSSVRRIPFLGMATARSGNLFIDRRHPRQALRDLDEAASTVRAGRSVLFFAEGTRSYAPILGALRPGAFRLALAAQVPLVPVAIRNSYRLADERAFAAQPGTVEVVIGRPIPTAGRGRRDLPALTDAVRDAIQAELADEAARWAATYAGPSAS